jgi:hypothetical protein
MAWVMLAIAVAAPPQDRDPETVRRQLHEILGRTEFRQKMPSEFWARLREQLRLRSSDDRKPEIERPQGRCPISTSGSFSGGLMNVLFIIGIAILAAFLIAIGYHAWKRRARSKPAPPAPAAPSSAMPDPLTRNSEEWAFEADRLFHLGRIAEAIRALYLAALSFSHGRRWIDYHPSKANWEHVRRFSGPTRAREQLGSLTSVFERKWYGRKPAEESEYKASRDMATVILQTGESAA